MSEAGPAGPALREPAAAPLKERWEGAMVPNYATPSLQLVRGEGAHVWDADGNRYLDLLAGIAVNVLGHAHPRIVEAVTHQVARLGHVSNLYASDVALSYAQRLGAIGGNRRVLLVNSGAEANEAALKLVRRNAHERGAGDDVVIAFEGSFHGRTLGTLSLTGQVAHRQGFGPLPGGVVHVPFNDPAALETAFADHDVAGVFTEYVQGEGGVRPMDHETADVLRRLTRSSDVLLVADEVQTGVARTGRFFAHEHYGHEPDVVTLAKGLGGGLPLGAMLVDKAHAGVLGPGTHGCTFGGNPVAVAAGDAVLDALEQESLIQRAEDLGGLMEKRLTEELGGGDLRPRGLGMLQGIGLPEPAAPRALQAAQDDGLLVGQAGKNVVRLAPPLIVDEQELEAALTKLATVVRSTLA